MNAKIQMNAEDIKPGMKIIPTGRKQPLEVLSADNWANPNVYLYGCHGKGFTVHKAYAGEKVTVVL